LRIGDAVTLERNRITGDKLFLYTAKMGTPVYVPLSDFVLDAFAAILKGGVPKVFQKSIKLTGKGLLFERKQKRSPELM
jgi:hypothetical protein